MVQHKRILVSACMTLLCLGVTDAQGNKPFTVKDSIETTHVVRDYGADPVLTSPDSRRFLVVLERGDVERNGSWVEFLSGSAESVRAARRLRIVARLFSTSTASDVIKSVRWLNDCEHIAFLWDNGREPAGVRLLDVRTGRVTTLAQMATPVVRYDISADGHTVVFMTEAPQVRRKEIIDNGKGFAVNDQSIWAVLRGGADDPGEGRHYDTFVLDRARGRQFKIREPWVAWATSSELLRLSPDGRYAVTVRPLTDVPENWDHYTDHLFRDSYLPAVRRNPQAPSWVRQYFIIDTKTLAIRPLWDAPENPASYLLWSKDSKSLVIGPTFVPTSGADALALEGQAVVEVEPLTGRFTRIPLPERLRNADRHPIRWAGNQTIEIGDEAAPIEGKKTELSTFEKRDGEWRAVREENVKLPTAKLRIELREDPNTPPSLHAVDTWTGASSLIWNSNAQLRHFALGKFEVIHWQGRDGRSWSGLLCYPIHYEPGKSFPLVIQTHGYLANQFSPDGVFSTVSAAEALASHDIAVLQVGAPDVGGEEFVLSPNEPIVYMAGFEGAGDALVSRGLADRAKIGIIGFSRTGWYVEYLLTHSDYKFAAAEVADNIDGGYLQYLFRGDGAKSEFEVEHGARPFGKGLETWLRTAPAFNADRVTAPLRLEMDSGPADEILDFWEMFSNLRSLGKPVELFVIPDIQHGEHILQNPRQRLASQGGTVDWFCFWLKGEIDSDPAKAEEYRHWERLKELKKRAVGPS
jgi:dipeptidyl aminopeptidase/acylaminoacyl peptidase